MPSDKFNKNQISKMRKMYEEGYAVQYIAREFKCRPNAVWNRVFDLSPPRHLNKEERKQVAVQAKLTAKEVREIRRLAIRKNVASNKLAQMYGISQSCALGVIRGKTYRWVRGYVRPTHDSPPVLLVPEEYPRHPAKTDLKRGFKARKSIRMVSNGTLVRLSELTGLSKSSISRILRKS